MVHKRRLDQPGFLGVFPTPCLCLFVEYQRCHNEDYRVIARLVEQVPVNCRSECIGISCTCDAVDRLQYLVLPIREIGTAGGDVVIAISCVGLPVVCL